MHADLERSSVGIHHCTVSFSLAGVEHAQILITVGPQIHAATVSLISVETTVVYLQ